MGRLGGELRVPEPTFGTAQAGSGSSRSRDVQQDTAVALGPALLVGFGTAGMEGSASGGDVTNSAFIGAQLQISHPSAGLGSGICQEKP